MDARGSRGRQRQLTFQSTLPQAADEFVTLDANATSCRRRHDAHTAGDCNASSGRAQGGVGSSRLGAGRGPVVGPAGLWEVLGAKVGCASLALACWPSFCRADMTVCAGCVGGGRWAEAETSVGGGRTPRQLQPGTEAHAETQPPTLDEDGVKLRFCCCRCIVGSAQSGYWARPARGESWRDGSLSAVLDGFGQENED